MEAKSSVPCSHRDGFLSYINITQGCVPRLPQCENVPPPPLVKLRWENNEHTPYFFTTTDRVVTKSNVILVAEPDDADTYASMNALPVILGGPIAIGFRDPGTYKLFTLGEYVYTSGFMANSHTPAGTEGILKYRVLVRITKHVESEHINTNDALDHDIFKALDDFDIEDFLKYCTDAQL